MKVLLINGSPHSQGNTSIALAEVAKQLEKCFHIFSHEKYANLHVFLNE